MEEKLHKNYRKVSNLIIILLVLELVDFLFSDYATISTNNFTSRAIGFLFIALTAYASRRGVNWVKYIVLVLTLLTIAGIVISISDSWVSSVNVWIASVQAVLLIVGTVWLFKIPTSSHENPLDSDI